MLPAQTRPQKQFNWIQDLMFGFLKNLLRKPSDDSADCQVPTAADQALPYPAPPSAAAPRPGHSRGAGAQNAKGIELPVQNIIPNLPTELQPRVRMPDTGDLTITVPLEKVLAQLSRGAVKISFGELRQAVPEVFTTENDRDRVLITLPLGDILARLSPALISRRRVQRQVQVPQEIASPFDGEGNGLVFSVASPGSATPPPKSPAPAAPKAPARQTSVSAPAPAVPAAAQRLSLKTAPTPAPPTLEATPPAHSGQIPFNAPPAAPVKAAAPAAPARPQPIAMPGIRSTIEQKLAPHAAVPPARPAPAPGTSHTSRPKPGLKPQAPAQPIAFTQAPPMQQPAGGLATTHTSRPTPAPKAEPPAHGPIFTQAPASTQPAPAPAARQHAHASPAPAARPPAPAAPVRHAAPTAPAAQVSAAPEVPEAPACEPVESGPVPEPLTISVAAVADVWPEPIRKEVVEHKLVEAKLSLPVRQIEQALKTGRILFSWKTVLGWVRPAPAPFNSAHLASVVELPLKVIAPLFLMRQREDAKPKSKISVDEDIPNLFFGFPQAEPAIPVAQATARPADTNFYVWDDSSDSVKVHEAETRRGPGPGTKFVAKYATPNEVVSRASSLDGVVGALIALPDGLMVANRLPSDVNAETLAAFLPQIFGKVSQCTKELRMGELNNLNFTVGNIPWKIFRVNSIFFATFGKPGEPLPTAQLAALAGELDHNPR